MSPTDVAGVTTPSELLFHTYGTGEKLPLKIPMFRPAGSPIGGYRLASGLYCTGDSTAWTLSAEQFRQFLQSQAPGQISPGLLQMFNLRAIVNEEREKLTPRQKLLKRILALRNSIQIEKGILSESYPFIRKDRER